MATNKLGTLVYDLVADTKGFQQGVALSRKEVTALKKVFLESRTPVEAFGIQMQGMQKLIESGSRPINMFSRSIADLAVKTKGGGREARAFVKSLREQASQIVQSVGHYRVLSKEDRERVDRLRAVARAIEREVDIQRNAAAQSLKSSRLQAQADRELHEQQRQSRLESERRAIAIKKEEEELRKKAKQEARVAELQRRQRSVARQAGARAAEQQQASSLALVRRELEKTITPQQKLIALASTARSEFAKGNITQNELAAIQRRVVSGLRDINPEILKQKEATQKLNEQLKQRQMHEQRVAAILDNRRRQQAEQGRSRSQQQESEQLAMVRGELQKTISPQQKLIALASASRSEFAKGNITREELLSIQKRITSQLRELNPELKAEESQRRSLSQAIKKQADAQELLSTKQKAEAQAIRDRQDPRRALAREMTGIRELGAAGMLSPAEVAAEQKRIAQSLRELNPEYQKQVQQLARVRKGLQNLITPQAKIRTQVKELVQEYRKGNVTYDQTVARIRQLREEYRNLNRVQDKNVASQSKVLQGIRNQTIALAKQVSAITLAYKAIRQLREGFSDALEIGRSQRQFETFTGSAQVASELMLQIRQFTAETPVTMRAAQQSVRTMLQYGVSQSEVVGRLKQLGDISGGSTESLQRLSLAFGQITANTRLQGQELRQLVEAGFNPLMFIAEQTGESMFDLRQRMSEGDLSVREIADALDAATSGAGRFANALKNVGEETAFGRIQRFVSEFEKLRADFMIPITALTGGAASKALDNLEQYRESAREAFRFDAEAGLEAKDLEPALKVLERQGLFGGFKGFSTIGLRMQKRLIEAVIEEQRSAAKARQASLDRELEEFMKPSSKRIEADTELLDVIHERISALRKEREELRLGEDEALLSDLRRQGASDEYINALREEMKLLAEAKRRQEELDDAEKKRHEESLKRQREREMAIEKSERDRARQIETDRRAAEALAKSIQTPLEALEAEMTDIQKVSEFLTVDQRVRLMQQAKERFDKAMQEDAKSQQEATAATRGSVEEFKLLSEINRQQINREQKNHNEAMGARNEGNRLLNLNVTGLNLLPMKLGAELSELMGVPVRRPGMPTFGASVSPSAYQ